MNDLLLAIPRVLHVGSAILLVGGAAFIRFVLMPAANATLTDADHDRLRARIMETWKKIVHGGIALLLLSGLFNYARVIMEQSHKGDKLYHALLGTKLLLALVVFFLSSALVGKSAGLAKIRQNAKKWLLVNLLLAVVIIAISGYLRVRGVPARPVSTDVKADIVS